MFWSSVNEYYGINENTEYVYLLHLWPSVQNENLVKVKRSKNYHQEQYEQIKNVLCIGGEAGVEESKNQTPMNILKWNFFTVRVFP